MSNAASRQFDFTDGRYELRRLFSELFGTFLLVLVAAGGPMVNARFGGHVTSPGALAVAPALTVMAVILFMGTVSGAHLNPAVTFGFALRGNFPWKRVPGYLAAQAAGAVGNAWSLRRAGGGRHGTEAAQGTLGTGWFPGPSGLPPAPAAGPLPVPPGPAPGPAEPRS